MWRDPTDDDSDRLEPCGELSPPLEREPAAERSGLCDRRACVGSRSKRVLQNRGFVKSKSGLLYINAEAGWWTHFQSFFFQHITLSSKDLNHES